MLTHLIIPDSCIPLKSLATLRSLDSLIYLDITGWRDVKIEVNVPVA